MCCLAFTELLTPSLPWPSLPWQVPEARGGLGCAGCGGENVRSFGRTGAASWHTSRSAASEPGQKSRRAGGSCRGTQRRHPCTSQRRRRAGGRRIAIVSLAMHVWP